MFFNTIDIKQQKTLKPWILETHGVSLARVLETATRGGN